MSSSVTLREITKESVRRICALEVAPHQQSYVARVAVSIAEAHFSPGEAWFRAIYAGEEPVGFVMLSVRPHIPDYFLWRLMIDERHQGRGFGRAALDRIVEHVRGLGATELQTTAVPGEHSPQPFYEKYGFEPTGVIEEGEVQLRLRLENPAPPREHEAAPRA